MLLACVVMLLQSKAGVFRGTISDEWLDKKVRMIRAHYPVLSVKDVPHPESWAVQLFRSIDSGNAALSILGNLHTESGASSVTVCKKRLCYHCCWELVSQIAVVF